MRDSALTPIGALAPILIGVAGGLLWRLARCCLWRRKRKKDFARRVTGLKKRFPNDRFAVVEYPPFIVVTDEEQAEITKRLEFTVPWVIEKLKNAYSWKNPRSVVEMWLFANRGHYDSCMKTFYDQTFRGTNGGFLPRCNAIVADISVGNGILVHEMVHAFVRANFPSCPSWFNEGLASLYNRCSEASGEMRGHPDGAVTTLQSAILSGRTLPIERLCALTYKEFHATYETRNYAQSRYLCYCLQERGLLREYYRAFYANRRRDPTGYRTLQKLVGGKDMRQFQEEWEGLVLAISTST
jgi:hypothetical protein